MNPEIHENPSGATKFVKELKLAEWHHINEIPYDIFYTVWDEFIETDRCELDSCYFRRVY